MNNAGKRLGKSSRRPGQQAAPAKTAHDEARRDDAQIVAALKEIAASLATHADHTHRRTGEVIGRFASIDGRSLRKWIAELRGRQAVFRALEDPEQGPGVGAVEAQPDKPKDAVIRDADGRPAVIDVAALLDSLAYWVASRRLPQPWRRSDSRLLTTVAAKTRELAALLGRADGPAWRKAIELFDSGARPRQTEGSLNTFRRDVSDRLHRQTLGGLLHNVAAEAERLGRMNQLDSAVQYAARPRAKGALDRLLAREIQDWFAMKCGNPASPDVIADVINLSRAGPVRAARQEVSGAQVKEWLRPPRKSSAESRR